MATTPRVSIFTPSHRTRFLDECVEAVLPQSYQDWEWIVVLNQGMRWRPESGDPRIRVVVDDDIVGVGAVKRRACAEARGEILLELDHDDLLTTDCLEAVVAAFDAYPGVGFVFSDAAQVLEDGSRDDTRFSADHGWTYRDDTVDGHTVLVPDAMPATPHNVSYIWYAPNHVRAFRRDIYDKVGGYDETLDVADDHDLMCRLYQVAAFHRIPRCLYRQRMHTKNTQRDPAANARIQERTIALYDRHIEQNALAWSKRLGLLALDLGSAQARAEGYLGVDSRDRPSVDLVGDLTRGIDLPDGSVGVIRAVDFLQSVPDRVALFNEVYRLLAPNGMFLSLTPSTDGRGAFQDPTHVAYYNQNSFWYFTDRDFAARIPAITCRFQLSRLVTYFPSEFHQANQISYVAANLVAVKDDTRNGGLLRI